MKITIKNKKPLPFAKTTEINRIEIDKVVLEGKTYTSETNIKEYKNTFSTKEMFQYYGFEYLDKMLEIKEVWAEYGDVAVITNDGTRIMLYRHFIVIEHRLTPKSNRNELFATLSGRMLTEKNVRHILNTIKEE